MGEGWRTRPRSHNCRLDKSFACPHTDLTAHTHVPNCHPTSSRLPHGPPTDGAPPPLQDTPAALPFNPGGPYASLTALLLPRNPLLGDTACEVLSEALQQPGCRLRELDLSRCVWVVGGCGERGALSST